MSRDVIAIRELVVDCVVGVYPHERDTLQPLRVSVELRLDTERAAARERLSRTVDYNAMSAQLVFLLQTCRFRLLETAAHALAKFLLAPPAPHERRAQVASLSLLLEKPNALDGHAVPSLRIDREASWVKLGREEKPFGTVDVIHETKEAGIYRLNVAPSKGIPLHVHRRMNEAEMVLGDKLLCQGKPVAAGTVHRWPHDTPHRYDNPSDRYQSILCVDSPPFIESDEIRVEGEPTAVMPEPRWPQR